MKKSSVSVVTAVVILLFVLSSCLSPKKVLYFQGLNTSRVDSVNFSKVHALQYGDVIEIAVTSLKEEDYLPFSQSGFRHGSGQGIQNSYLVDSSGVISLPYIGSLQIAGSNTIDLRQRLQQLLVPYLQNATVNVNLINLKISILGEVARPGTFQIPDMRIALPEALGLAGDLTIMGKRSNILVIREQNGQRTYAKLDLRNPDVLGSPYYYLKPNDIIYVEPSRSRIAQGDTRTWQILTFIVTVTSLATILATRL